MIPFQKKNSKRENIIQAVNRYEYSSFQGIGNRKEQQDSFFISRPDEGFDVSRKGLMLAVADGMGGMDSGDKFSGVVCDSIKEYFADENINVDDKNIKPEEAYLKGAIDKIDANVKALSEEEELGDGGSTLCLVRLADGKMSFASVGDSRIYLLRESRLCRVNAIHNLRNKFLEKLANREISWEDYHGLIGREGLTSYIGIEELTEVDIKTDISLLPGDVVMIFSDGVFGTLSDDEIKAIAEKRDVIEAAYMFEKAINSIGNDYQDNFTGIIVKCFK